LLVGLFYLLFALINYTTMLDENRLSTTLLAVSVTIVFFMFSAFHKFKDYAATYPNHLSFVVPDLFCGNLSRVRLRQTS